MLKNIKEEKKQITVNNFLPYEDTNQGYRKCQINKDNLLIIAMI